MAGSVLTAPSTTLSTNTVWQNELAYTEAARYGYDGVSLTNWASGNTTIPEIAAGSVIEIDGAMCEYSADTALTTTGIADGWCYIKHVVSGAVVTPTLTNTFGTWDTAKQGYYDGSGNRYSLFVMYRSGAVTKIYTQKGTLERINVNGVVSYLDGSMGDITTGTITASGAISSSSLSTGTITASGAISSSGLTATGTIKAGSYQSSDGSVGVTNTAVPISSITEMVVKDGLVISWTTT